MKTDIMNHEVDPTETLQQLQSKLQEFQTLALTGYIHSLRFMTQQCSWQNLNTKLRQEKKILGNLWLLQAASEPKQQVNRIEINDQLTRSADNGLRFFLWRQTCSTICGCGCKDTMMPDLTQVRKNSRCTRCTEAFWLPESQWTAIKTRDTDKRHRS